MRADPDHPSAEAVIVACLGGDRLDDAQRVAQVEGKGEVDAHHAG